MKKLQFVLWILILIAVIILLGGWGYNFVKYKTEKIVHPEVSFEIENYGTVKFELYPEYAPNTVLNIIKLVEAGYYNNKTIYGKDNMCIYAGRDSEGEAIVATAGLISSEIEEGSEDDYKYSIEGEFVANGFKKNTLRNEVGTISLIRNNYGTGLTEESFNSGNAQLGIMMTKEANNLNGLYATFGKVIEGMEILEKMYNEAEIHVNTEEDGESSIDKFENSPVITSATVDTHGVGYGMPEIKEAFDYESYLYNQYMQQNNSGN